MSQDGSPYFWACHCWRFDPALDHDLCHPDPHGISSASFLARGFCTTRGESGEKNWLREGLSIKLVHLLDIPVLLVQVFESGAPEAPHLGRILVVLDGSAFSEQILPYARLMGKQFNCELMLISVPSVPESEKYRAPASILQAIRRQAETSMRKYLESVADRLRAEGLSVRAIVSGSYPARSIVDVGKREGVDLNMITSQGRGGLDLVFMGSVAQ